jgi:hypothetical protein
MGRPTRYWSCYKHKINCHFMHLIFWVLIILILVDMCSIAIGFNDWRGHHRYVSLLVVTGGILAFLLSTVSGFGLLLPLYSAAVTFLLLPLWMFSNWMIYKERRWLLYAVLFLLLCLVIAWGFLIDVKLSTPLSNWPLVYYIWLLALIGTGIPLLLL